jgi:hypothetical protein
MSNQANTLGIRPATPTGTNGGKIRICDSADLELASPVNHPLVLNVTTDLFRYNGSFPNTDLTTNSHVSRIRGILPSPDSRYMALNFLTSGHLGIVDAATKKSLCLFRTTQTTTGRHNHMSFWTPSGNQLIAANQNGCIFSACRCAAV